jgi:prepilin-type N-terminal cleavage/methylation domain-containing protein
VLAHTSNSQAKENKMSRNIPKKPMPNSARAVRALPTGFSLPEALIATSIIGILGSIAVPKYYDQIQQSNNKEIQSKVASIPTVIGAYIDAIGELPTKWDDLSSIAAVMTNNGPATGDLTTPITLPNSKYELSVAGPTESIYILTATRLVHKNIEDPEEVEQNRFGIYSCCNVSNGASDLKSGNGIEIKATLNCG